MNLGGFLIVSLVLWLAYDWSAKKVPAWRKHILLVMLVIDLFCLIDALFFHW